jgi:hypothetical protein
MADTPAPKTARQQLDEMMQQVRSLPPGGDLASLLTREITALAQAAERDALDERKKTEQDRREAGFPPSGESLQ